MTCGREATCCPFDEIPQWNSNPELKRFMHGSTTGGRWESRYPTVKIEQLLNPSMKMDSMKTDSTMKNSTTNEG